MGTFNIKTIKIIGIFGTFLLSIIFHFMYKWFPNTFFSILFPVNESIWEHMKLISTSSFFFSLIEYYIYKKLNITFHNFSLSYATACIISTFLYLVIYLSIYKIIGNNTVVAIILLFLSFALVQFISYKILTINKLNFNGLPLIFIIYLLFTVLTYKPLHNYLFLDSQGSFYGIKKANK